jgi:hypothetical protein
VANAKSPGDDKKQAVNDDLTPAVASNWSVCHSF